MRLYLIQTGEALSKETTDFDRPLSRTGKLNVEKLASLLSRTHLEAKRVIHSGNIRARETLEILRWAATAERRLLETRAGLNPEDPVEPWVREISTWQDDAVIVGHQPFLGRLLSALVAGAEEPPIAFFVPTTAVCVERRHSRWGIVWMMPPELSAISSRY